MIPSGNSLICFCFVVQSKAASKETRGAPPPPTGAGGPIDLVFSFDTTGSMYSCLDEVRKNLQTMITRILSDIPSIKIAVCIQPTFTVIYFKREHTSLNTCTTLVLSGLCPW